MDTKGVYTYIAVTLGLAYAIELLIFSGLAVPGLAYLIAFVPAAGALIASRVSSGRDFPVSTVRPLPMAKVVRIAVVVPLIFVAIHVITALLGQGQPYWRVGPLLVALPSARELNLDENLAPLLPRIYLVMGFVISILLGPTLFALLALGNEYGWRGYLLPRLMYLGRWRAYRVVGVLWGFSIAPLVYHYAEHSRVVHVGIALAMTTSISALLGEVWRRSHHLGFCAVCCGCIASQAFGMWMFLFPHEYMNFPWGGTFGLIAVAVWVVAALLTGPLFGRIEPAPVPEEPAS